MKILIVKLSSLGDVLHNLPIVWDLRAKYPEAQIDWVVEEGYVGLLEPLKTTYSDSLPTPTFSGIDRIIPLAFRRWKKALKRGEFIKSIQEYIAFKADLQTTAYDLIIETQGLLKSAWVTKLANPNQTAKVFGLANQTEFSGYEPWARRFYTDCVQVPFHCHAVDRSRWVTASAMDVPVPNRTAVPPRFYPQSYVQSLVEAAHLGFASTRIDLGFDVTKPYVMCFHATAGASKRWSNDHWVSIGKALVAKGMQVVLPWGNDKEKEISIQLAKKISGHASLEGSKAIVPNAFSIADAFGLVAGAKVTIGVDTGLTHLAAILGLPTIELYCDSPKWKTEGYWSPNICNLGDKGKPPTAEQVLSAIDQLLSA
ncbi:MAG: lipopolysaccharide heptosyltransferase I [Polynucleobacter sp.]|nr:MAG: lipopolysaccharide heptosyltransferase I [Polynucleobacter sp.]